MTSQPQMAFGNSSKRALTELLDHLTGDSAPLPNLPEEIITEILLRLPVKALLRFRCVSKSWLSLISTPQFVNNHLKISSKDNTGCHNRLIFGSGSGVFYTFSLYPKKDENPNVDTLLFDYPLTDPDDSIRVVGSCNGLVCVALDPCSVVLWNPAIGKSKKLPFSESIFGMEYGFGYDASNDDYIVVEYSWISSNEGEYKTQLKVYSSRADSWRIVDWPHGKIFDGPGVFVNGALHWKVARDDSRSDWFVIAQNMTTETCSSLELPVLVSRHKGANVMLGVCGGCLCVSDDCYSYMDVWVMKEYGVRESWTKLVCFPYFFCRNHLSHFRPKLLFVSENGGILVNLGSDLIMHKPSQYHEIHRLSNNIEVEATTYCESLLSPDLDI